MLFDRHSGMHSFAIGREIVARHQELLQRRIDVVKIDIGQETIDRGIDAPRLAAEQEVVFPDQIGQDPQAVAAVDLALWDLAGRQARQPGNGRIWSATSYSIST